MILVIMGSPAYSSDDSEEICNSYTETLNIALSAKVNGADIDFLIPFYNKLVVDKTIKAESLDDRLLITQGVFDYVNPTDRIAVELYGLSMIQWCKAKFTDSPQTSLEIIPGDEAVILRGEVYRCPAGTNQYGASACLEA